jgi:predicted DNA-binding protein with PD1-like motif
MTGRLLADTGGQRTFVIVFDTGDDAVDGLLTFARERGISAASYSAIGAFRSVTLGYFEVDRRDYRRIPIDEQVEVLSFIGNVALGPEGIKLHTHVVVGKRDGTAHGGHLLAARVRPTLEVVLVEVPAHLRRRIDPATGLALIDVRSIN